ADGDLRRRAGQRLEVDVDVLGRVVPVPVLDRVDDRLAHGDADPVPIVLVEAHGPAQIVADDLNAVQHLKHAGELEMYHVPGIYRHQPWSLSRGYHRLRGPGARSIRSSPCSDPHLPLSPRPAASAAASACQGTNRFRIVTRSSRRWLPEPRA